jgi:hypothetical protein
MSRSIEGSTPGPAFDPDTSLLGLLNSLTVFELCWAVIKA